MANPLLLGLRSAIYPVDDLSKAKAWYEKALGVKPYFDEPFYVGFEIGGYELGLDPDVASLRRGSKPVALWGVIDAKAAFKSLIKQGAKKVEEPHEVGGGICVATVEDPFGNRLGLVQNPNFKAK